MTTEAKVAEALLQREQEVTLSGKVYKVAPPSMATLILVSECISELPDELFIVSEDQDVNITLEALRSARYARPLGRAVATLIIGAKKIRKQNSIPKCLQWLGGKVQRERLAQEILENYPPSQIASLFLQIMAQMEVGDFFALTAFLKGVRVTHPTRTAEIQTAPGL